MQPIRRILPLLLLSLSTAAFAQTDAQKSFDMLKHLAGSWQGTVEGTPIHVSLRVTSTGNAVLHEMSGPGRPDDPITMLHLDGDRLMMTHYCDAGNQPRFIGHLSPDGKTISFDFLDITNNSDKSPGHMQHVVFTFLDANHHIEDWTFQFAGKPPMTGHMELARAQ